METRRIGQDYAAGRVLLGFVEDELASVWCELLDVTGVRAHDSFAALGGDAALAARLADRVGAALGVSIAPADLLSRDTLAAMAGHVRSLAAFRTGAAAAEPRAEGLLPLSFAQQRMWFMQEIDPDSVLYHVPAVLYLRGSLDLMALRRALAALLARHESLRTTFPIQGGLPHQLVGPVPDELAPVVDLTAGPDPAGRAQRIAAGQAAEPFDLAAGPLMRATLLRLAPDEHRLVMTFHHIVVDGWSLDVLFRDLTELYRATATGTAPVLPDLPLHYADYAARERDRLRGPVLEELVRHWRGVLGGDPVAFAPPADHPRPARGAFRGAVVHGTLGADMAVPLRDFARRHRVTANMTMLAAFSALLATWSGEHVVTVGIPVAGRTRPELADIVGCLMNMLPVRTDLSGDPPFREVVARTRVAVLDASAHQDLPFGKLVEALVPRQRRRDFSPVFRVMFSYESRRREPRFPGVRDTVLEVHTPPGTAKYDLSLYVVDRGSALHLTLEYDRDLYRAGTAAALLDAYRRTLTGALASPGSPAPRHLPVRHDRSPGARPTPVIAERNR